MRKFASATLAILLFILPLGLAGCGASELVQSIDVARDVVSAAEGILSAGDPEAGEYLKEAGADLKLLADLVGQYDKAVAAGKPGIGAQIEGLTGALTANLTRILAAAHVKHPELVEYITVAVAIANSVVGTVIEHLPANGSWQRAVNVRAQSASLPTIPYSSPKDLKNAWNSAVSQAYPGAKI